MASPGFQRHQIRLAVAYEVAPTRAASIDEYIGALSLQDLNWVKRANNNIGQLRGRVTPQQMPRSVQDEILITRTSQP